MLSLVVVSTMTLLSGLLPPLATMGQSATRALPIARREIVRVHLI